MSEKLLGLKFTFGQSPELIRAALDRPELKELFSTWHHEPVYEATPDEDIDDPGECSIAVRHPDREPLGEALDIIQAFLTGYFAK